MKLFLIIFVIVIGLAGGSLFILPSLRDGLPSFSSGPTGTEVRMEAATHRELTESIPARGDIEPHTEIKISSQVVAEIRALPFREGDLVSKGDLVVELDDEALLARLEAAQASLASMKASEDASTAGRARTKAQLDEQLSRRLGLLDTLGFAQRSLERKQELYESGDIAMSELDVALERVHDVQTQITTADSLISGAESSLASADADIERAGAGVLGAEADIKLAEEGLRNTRILSPIDGKVVKLNAEVGETVMTGTMNNAGTVILTIADLTRMKMIAQVDEADVAPLAVGQTARVHIRSYPDEVFSGVVDQIALERTTSGDGTGFFEAEILLRLDGREILSGGSANADIEVGTHSGLIVPSQAIVDRDIEDMPQSILDESPLVDRTKRVIRVAYLVVDGKAVATPVNIGASDETHTVVTEGLSAGDIVVTGPYKVLDIIKHDEAVIDINRPKNASEQSPSSDDDDDDGGSPLRVRTGG